MKRNRQRPSFGAQRLKKIARQANLVDNPDYLQELVLQTGQCKIGDSRIRDGQSVKTLKTLGNIALQHPDPEYVGLAKDILKTFNIHLDSNPLTP